MIPGKMLYLIGKISLSATLKTGMQAGRNDEVLPSVREATEIFRDIGSRHLPEMEITLEELHGLCISKDLLTWFYRRLYGLIICGIRQMQRDAEQKLPELLRLRELCCFFTVIE